MDQVEKTPSMKAEAKWAKTTLVTAHGSYALIKS